MNACIRKETEAKVAVAKKKMEDAEAEKERMRENWLGEDSQSSKANNVPNGGAKAPKTKNEKKKGGKSNKKK